MDIAQLHPNTRFATLASYLIVSCMAACGIVTFVQVGSILLPGWDGRYLVVLGFLVSLEVFYTERFRKHLAPLVSEWFAFYLSEWLVLFLLLKGFLLLRGGFDRLLAELAAWRVDFFASFFNAELIFSLFVLFATWIVSLSFATPLEVLRVSPLNIQIEEDIGNAPERATARQQIADLVLMVGLVLVVLTSLMRSDRAANWFQLPAMRAGVVNLLVYFTLGLTLLSLTQFSVLQMRWSINRIRISDDISRRWVLYSLMFLGFLAGGALLLPTRYTVSVLTLLNWLLAAVTAVFALLSWLVTAAFMAIIALLSLLMGRPPEQEALPPLPIPTQLPVVEAIEINPLSATIRSLIFWIAIGALLVYMLYYFLKIRRQDLSSLLHAPLIGWVVNLARQLITWLSGLGRQASGAVQAGVKRLRRTKQPVTVQAAWRYTSLRRMTPRQRVVFYYLALVRRGAESGLPRNPAQTPYEYAEQLAASLPEGDIPTTGTSQEQDQHDLETMTEHFVQARYSLHDVSPQQARGVQASWRRMQHALRRMRGH